MSEEDFRRYATTGFTFKLIGTGGAVEGSLPATAFKEVLQQMGR